MTHPEENNPIENTYTPEDLGTYGVCDWADAIVDAPDASSSNNQEILNVATWYSPDFRTRYKLKRHQVYSRRKATPSQDYLLEVHDDSANPESFTGYYYKGAKGKAIKCDMEWKKLYGGQKAQETEQEMLGHLRTSSVNPRRAKVSKMKMLSEFEKIHSEEFNRRDRVRLLLGRPVTKYVTRPALKVKSWL